MYESVLPEHAARTILFRMGFSDRDIEKEVCVLSGGERARVVLCALLAGDYNILLLDEPGNHLDLTALEALEEMLSVYPGTLLLVSHDMRMINRVAHRLLLFEKGGLREIEGNLEAYGRERGKKDEERTKMMASVFSNYLKEQGLSDTIIDTSRGNEINKIFVRFYRKMVKSENIESQPNGSACFRFLTEDCGLKIAPNMKTYGTFISRMINDA
jgi:ABC-type multidrug transport system ATPase subunit